MFLNTLCVGIISGYGGVAFQHGHLFVCTYSNVLCMCYRYVGKIISIKAIRYHARSLLYCDDMLDCIFK